MDKLDKFMRGDAFGKADVYHGRGHMTPSGTPGSNSILPAGAGRPPNFQRTNSNESGKGSYSSDKDVHYAAGAVVNGTGNGADTGGGGGGGGPLRD